MFFFITYYLLEIIFGTTYWILCKTSKGIYYLVFGSNGEKVDKADMVIMSNKEDSNSNLIEALETIKQQNKKIEILNSKIDKILMTNEITDGFIEVSNKNNEPLST